MDTRVLKYFLTVASTNNITKAAQQLHITQPTLSRQIMELERELGAQLFERQRRHLQLTKAGALFQQRATTLLEIVAQTKSDLKQPDEELTGTINLGCVVSAASAFMMDAVADFQRRYPYVRFNIFDGDGDTLRNRLDEGRTDIACLIEPVEAAKYNYLVLPTREQWGVITVKGTPIAKRKTVDRNTLYKLPLIFPQRSIVRDEVSDVLKLDQAKLNIMASNNLPSNAMYLVRTGRYYAVAIKGITDLYDDSDLVFVPFTPAKKTGHVVVWRRNNILPPATERFLQFVAERTSTKK
ncbi:LysR family transcriptional regulator [Limosilactobacillus sp.]|uniref:LysR family transcriptional regulator n=1 Tax=Limosilactobacillus sp. TaxID=2773925 RepID=UPI003F070158